MTARLIDGKAFAAQLRERVAVGAKKFESIRGRAPGLAVVLVGEHPPSAAYVRSKAKATREACMNSFEAPRVLPTLAWTMILVGTSSINSMATTPSTVFSFSFRSLVT